MKASPDYLAAHRCHDVPHLLRRWQAVARAARLECHPVCESGGHPVLFLHRADAPGARLYLSAGVHGDEPGAVMGLLEWAEASTTLMRRLPVAIFPLFNPAGLALNTRTDHRHTDLNRCFHLPRHPHIRAWRSAIRGMTFTAGICLHEDYDAQGIYCYELNEDARRPVAHTLLRHCESIIPREPRRLIDGRRATAGVIRRRRVPDVPGLPEAIALYGTHTPLTLTFETPSEFSLHDRARAHHAFINAALHHLLGE